ncbi:aldo/keto reductase family oxidoreductase [Nocardioides endophyticus]|uniref:Aldo/keto reductase family oxidoreductase n=1 Tax=Nocardioides endophyticus TaxID=1353775 RepID=A0ABP8Z8Y5_9ACTN
MTTSTTSLPGGTWTMGDLTVTRVGYGAMQLAGPHVFGPPADHDGALAVLRTVVDLGINHIDTSDFYGPHVTNRIIKEALHPYADDLVIVTKVGGRRDDQRAWLPAQSPAELRQGVLDNLENLGLDAMDVVNLRIMDADDASIAERMEAMAALQQEGLVRHIGLSTVSAAQVAEAQAIAPIVCVQNHYNVAHREDDSLIESLAEQDIAYVPYFPLGGFTPLQSSALSAVAARLEASPLAVALAWLLQRSPNLLLIPGTSSVVHLRENVAGAGLTLSAQDVAELDAIGG